MARAKRSAARTTKYTNFSFPISTYFPQALQDNHSETELRREYSRLRRTAKARMSALQRSQYGGTQMVKKYKDAFPGLRQIQNKGDLSHILTQTAQFLLSETGSVTGMREYVRKNVESLQASGYVFITKDNFLEFADFMDWVDNTFGKDYYRARNGGKPDVVGVYNELKGKGYNSDKIKDLFTAWQEGGRRALEAAEAAYDE